MEKIKIALPEEDWIQFLIEMLQVKKTSLLRYCEQFPRLQYYENSLSSENVTVVNLLLKPWKKNWVNPLKKNQLKDTICKINDVYFCSINNLSNEKVLPTITAWNALLVNHCCCLTWTVFLWQIKTHWPLRVRDFSLHMVYASNWNCQLLKGFSLILLPDAASLCFSTAASKWLTK